MKCLVVTHTCVYNVLQWSRASSSHNFSYRFQTVPKYKNYRNPIKEHVKVKQLY